MTPIPFDPYPSGAAALGQLPPPEVSQAKRDAIAKAVDQALDLLELEIETVGAEMEAVSPSSLRTDPEAWKSIAAAQAGLSPYEIRTVLAAAETALAGLAWRIQSKALSHYLSESQAARAAKARSSALAAASGEQALDVQPVQAGHERGAEDEINLHLSRTAPAIENAERLVVEGEAPAVPVREPAEKGAVTTALAVGVGAILVGAFLLWQLLG
jgi:hypothetical protein